MIEGLLIWLKNVLKINNGINFWDVDIIKINIQLRLALINGGQKKKGKRPNFKENTKINDILKIVLEQKLFFIIINIISISLEIDWIIKKLNVDLKFFVYILINEIKNNVLISIIIHKWMKFDKNKEMNVKKKIIKIKK